jgi:hypothetical protein
MDTLTQRNAALIEQAVAAAAVLQDQAGKREQAVIRLATNAQATAAARSQMARKPVQPRVVLGRAAIAL